MRKKMMRFAVSIAVAVPLVLGGMASTASATMCERAAAAGYNHPGLNAGCAMEILMDMFWNGQEV